MQGIHIFSIIINVVLIIKPLSFSAETTISYFGKWFN